MAQYVDINGVSKQVGSVATVDTANKKITVDGTDFSVKGIADDVNYLGTLSAGTNNKIAYLGTLSAGMFNSLSDVSSATADLQISDIVKILYNIKILLQP